MDAGICCLDPPFRTEAPLPPPPPPPALGELTPGIQPCCSLEMLLAWELPCPGFHPLPGAAHTWELLSEHTDGPPPWSWFEATPKDWPSSRASLESAKASGTAEPYFNFLSCSDLLLSRLFRRWSQEHFPVNFLCANPHVRVCFLGKSTCDISSHKVSTGRTTHRSYQSNSSCVRIKDGLNALHYKSFYNICFFPC